MRSFSRQKRLWSAAEGGGRAPWSWDNLSDRRSIVEDRSAWDTAPRSRRTYQRKTEQIETEAALDGIYVLRTSVPDTELCTGEVVRSDKNLEQVERAFKTFKGPELEVRPIHHHLEDRVRAHVFLCILAYYLTWHLRHAWAPLLFNPSNHKPSLHPLGGNFGIRSPAAGEV
jgi:hypothetical protein